MHCVAKVDGCTYVNKVFALHAILVLDFQKDIADGVNDQNLAVLRDDALLGSLWTGDDLCLDWGANAVVTRLLGSLRLLGFLCILLHGASLATVAWANLLRGLFGGLVLELLGVHRGGAGVNSRNALETTLITPSSLARLADEPLGVVPAALPSHDQGEVVEASTENDE